MPIQDYLVGLVIVMGLGKLWRCWEGNEEGILFAERGQAPTGPPE